MDVLRWPAVQRSIKIFWWLVSVKSKRVTGTLGSCITWSTARKGKPASIKLRDIVKLAHNRFLRQKAADVKLGAARMSHVQPQRLIVTPDCDCIHDMAWPCDNPACNTGGIPVGNEGRVL